MRACRIGVSSALPHGDGLQAASWALMGASVVRVGEAIWKSTPCDTLATIAWQTAVPPVGVSGGIVFGRPPPEVRGRFGAPRIQSVSEGEEIGSHPHSDSLSLKCLHHLPGFRALYAES